MTESIVITGERDVLHPAFEAFKSFHDDGDDNAIMDFTVHKNSILVMCVDATNSCIILCRLPVKVSVETTETFSFPIDSMVAALKHMPDGAITIDMNGGLVTVKGGRRKTTFPMRNPKQDREPFMNRWARYMSLDGEGSDYSKFYTSGEAVRSFTSLAKGIVESPVIRWSMRDGECLMQAISSDESVLATTEELIPVEMYEGPKGSFSSSFQLNFLLSMMALVKKIASDANLRVSLKGNHPVKIDVGSPTTASRVVCLLAPFIEI